MRYFASPNAEEYRGSAAPAEIYGAKFAKFQPRQIVTDSRSSNLSPVLVKRIVLAILVVLIIPRSIVDIFGKEVRLRDNASHLI